jgi:putative hydrolases of HD superfamily
MIERMKKQMEFIVEIDRIKSIFRKTKLFDGSRHENDAEHSWHLAMMALLLGEYSNEKIDILKTVKMVLIHDIVEIDAGDVMVYDVVDSEKLKKETSAAERIFGILPEDQKAEFMALWKEFEVKRTPESRFAAAVDRLEPVMQNYHNDAETWKEHGIKYGRIREINEKMKAGSEALWEFAHSMIAECREKHYI